MIILNIIILFVITIIILALLMLFIAFKINFVFDSDRENINLTVLWLYPFIKAEVFMKDITPMLRVFLLKFKIYEKAIRPKKGMSKKLSLVKDIKFDDINLTAYYGFKDKFTVGIVCGLINFATQFIQFRNLKNIEQMPDFMADNDYIFINANATMKIGPNLF